MRLSTGFREQDAVGGQGTGWWVYSDRAPVRSISAHCECRATLSVARELEVRGALIPELETQSERGKNREGRKRAEKGQKMAGRTNRVRSFPCDISMLGWLGNLDSNQD